MVQLLKISVVLVMLLCVGVRGRAQQKWQLINELPRGTKVIGLEEKEKPEKKKKQKKKHKKRKSKRIEVTELRTVYCVRVREDEV